MKINMYCIWGTLLAWAVKLKHFSNWSGLSKYIFKPSPLRCFAQLPACPLASLHATPIASTSSGAGDWERPWALGLTPSFGVAGSGQHWGCWVCCCQFCVLGTDRWVAAGAHPGSPGMLWALRTTAWYSFVACEGGWRGRMLAESWWKFREAWQMKRVERQF